MRLYESRKKAIFTFNGEFCEFLNSFHSLFYLMFLDLLFVLIHDKTTVKGIKNIRLSPANQLKRQKLFFLRYFYRRFFLFIPVPWFSVSQSNKDLIPQGRTQDLVQGVALFKICSLTFFIARSAKFFYGFCPPPRNITYD